jgi:NADH:ubiquinone oxidoreductase subunit 3 (subunit A)
MVGSYECGDEPSGSGALELVSLTRYVIFFILLLLLP